MPICQKKTFHILDCLPRNCRIFFKYQWFLSICIDDAFHYHNHCYAPAWRTFSMPLSLPFFTYLVIYPSLLFCFHKSPHWRIMIIMINCRVVNAHLNYWQKHITDLSLFFFKCKETRLFGFFLDVSTLNCHNWFPSQSHTPHWAQFSFFSRVFSNNNNRDHFLQSRLQREKNHA